MVGKKKKGFARKRGFSGSSKKKPLPPPIPTTSTPPGVLLSNSVIPESLLNDIAEPRIQLNVHIPNIGFYFKTAVRCSLTVKEVKLNFMKKMASVCTEKQNPDSYYIHAKGGKFHFEHVRCADFQIRFKDTRRDAAYHCCR